jgi:hypothetical protein
LMQVLDNKTTINDRFKHQYMITFIELRDGDRCPYASFVFPQPATMQTSLVYKTKSIIEAIIRVPCTHKRDGALDFLHSMNWGFLKSHSPVPLRISLRTSL